MFRLSSWLYSLTPGQRWTARLVAVVALVVGISVLWAVDVHHLLARHAVPEFIVHMAALVLFTSTLYLLFASTPLFWWWLRRFSPRRDR